jgi:hypothetical protein
MRKLLYFFCVMLIGGCKNETAIDDLPLVTPKLPENKVEVVAAMIVKEDDIFEVFYTEDGTRNFGPKSVRVTVPGIPERQLITFALPDNALPTNIRLDVGQNPDQEEMIIEKIIVKFHKDTLKITGEDFFRYFIPNGNIKVSPKKKMIIPSPQRGGYDPAFSPEPELTGKLMELVNQENQAN